MHWLAALFVLIHLALPITNQPILRLSEQTDPQITVLGVAYTFGEQITFRVRVEPVDEVQEMLVFITPEGQPTVWEKVSLDKADTAGNITQVVDPRQIALYPFSTIQYRYEASLKDGRTISSPANSFQYEDNRFKWHNLQSGIFKIQWYGDDLALGQEIANIADKGLQESQSLLKATPPSPLRLYAYTSTQDLQTALQLTNQPWVAGHATPQIGMILISIPSGPEKKLELERQIPHEIMHILQYQVMGNSYRSQPVWLVEGMASLAELYPNPEYGRVLEANAKSDSLIPFSNLCTSFPREASTAFLSYAQSESFVRYLHDKYGSSGLQKLINQYQNGVSCEEGVSAAFGVSLNQLEYRWRQEVLGINIGGLVISNLSPYLLVGLLLLIPAGIAFLPYHPPKPRAHPVK